MLKKKFRNEYWNLKQKEDADNYTISSVPGSDEFVLTISKRYPYNNHACKIGLYKMQETAKTGELSHVKQLQQITLQAKPIVASAVLSAYNDTESCLREASHCIFAAGHDDGRVNIFETSVPEFDDEFITCKNGTRIVRHYNQGKVLKSSMMQKTPPPIDQLLNWNISSNSQNLITVVGNSVLINDINRSETVYTKNFSSDTSFTETTKIDSALKYCDINPGNLTLLGMVFSSGNATLLDLRSNKHFSSNLGLDKKSLPLDYSTFMQNSKGKDFDSPYHARCSWLDQYKLCTTNANQTNMVEIWDIRYAGKHLYQLKHEDPYTSITSLKTDFSNGVLYTSDSAGSVVSWDAQKIVSSKTGTLFTTTLHATIRGESRFSDFDVHSASCGNYVVFGNQNRIAQPRELSLVGFSSSLLSWDTKELGCHNLCEVGAIKRSSFDVADNAYSYKHSDRAESIASSSFSDNSILSSLVFSSASDAELPSPTLKN
ncbi:hypothetical protein ACO0QE_004406 [Hanseniaspora vineae]